MVEKNLRVWVFGMLNLIYNKINCSDVLISLHVKLPYILKRRIFSEYDI